MPAHTAGGRDHCGAGILKQRAGGAVETPDVTGRTLCAQGAAVALSRAVLGPEGNAHSQRVAVADAP